MHKRFNIIILAVVLAAGGYYGFFGGDKSKEKVTPSVPVRVETAAMRSVPLNIGAVGSVVPYQTVGIRSRLDSQIVEVKFHDGDMVKAGDVLFVLDDRALKAQLGELEANVKRDRAQLENFRQQYERTLSLNKQGFASASKLDTDKAAYAAQRAVIGASEASLQNTRVMLGYTQITAPISGRTGTINVTVGNTVKANDAQALVTINQLRPIRVQTSLPQRYLNALRDAMAAGVSVTTGEGAEGRLEYIDNKVDAATGTFEARASFANQDEKLWPGMFVNLQVDLGDEKNVLTIPEVAVQHGQDGDFVYVVKDNKATRQPVKVARIEQSVAVVETGLDEGAQVVTDGVATLKEGSVVKVGQKANE